MDDFAETISPELALVCPSLRASAIAGLPEIDPNALFAFVRAAPQARSAGGPRPSIIVALSAYFLLAVARTLAAGFAVVVVVVAILAAVSLL